MGLRVRLKASVNISHLPYQARVVAQALKTYGLILADNGSPWYISGAPSRALERRRPARARPAQRARLPGRRHQLAAPPRPLSRAVAGAPKASPARSRGRGCESETRRPSAPPGVWTPTLRSRRAPAPHRAPQRRRAASQLTERDRLAAGVRRRAPAVAGRARGGPARGQPTTRRRAALRVPARRRAWCGDAPAATDSRAAVRPDHGRAGCGAIASSLPRAAAQLDLGGYRHDVGLAWLWLAARGGRLRPAARDRLRAPDALARRHAPSGASEPVRRPAGRRRARRPRAAALPGPGAGDRVRPPGRARARADAEVGGPAARGSSPATPPTRGSTRSSTWSTSRRSGRAISRSAARLGISDRVHVQRVSFARSTGGRAPPRRHRARGRAERDATAADRPAASAATGAARR